MEIVITATPESAAEMVADTCERLLKHRPEAVIGLATGSSPLPAYQEMVRRHRDGRMSFAGATAFLLDEYVGLPPGHPESYREFIRRELTDQVDLSEDRLHSPDASGPDPAGAGVRYEQQISDAGGIDLQILGIGSDGHIGFNEPSSSLGSRTRMKTLTAQTRRDNARFFGGDQDAVPRHVITQGIGTILDAGHLVMIATGSSKAGPIAAAFEGPITSMVPASALQFHPHTTVVIDEDAAVELRHAGYYREAFSNKPDWQHL
ncbi:MAG: glucosamine-6-phosphate deaminase [Acidimicrobiales bacterium]